MARRQGKVMRDTDCDIMEFFQIRGALINHRADEARINLSDFRALTHRIFTAQISCKSSHID